MRADRDTVLSIAKTAQIRIPEDEVDRTVSSINDVLSFCAVVGELDVDGTPDFSWKMKEPPARRADNPVEWADRDSFNMAAPTIEGDFFKVPCIATED